VDEQHKIMTELAKIDEGKIKAIAEGDRVYLMIQDAPAELRKLADALEKIDVREIKALVAYAKPGTNPKKGMSTRTQRALESSMPLAGVRAEQGADLEGRVEAVLARFRPRLRKIGAGLSLRALQDGTASLRFTVEGEAAPDVERIRSEVLAELARDVPEVKKVELM
jgi:hypothetical protein